LGGAADLVTRDCAQRTRQKRIHFSLQEIGIGFLRGPQLMIEADGQAGEPLPNQNLSGS
jgi:hypothetical protein